MASFFNLFVAFLAISLCFSEQGQAVTCDSSSIQLAQAETGAVVGGAPEYEVTITNTCSCPRSNVVVSCGSFVSRESVDPNLFRRIDEDNCLANNGRPILQSPPFKFRYSWPRQFVLFPITPSVNC